MSDVPNEHPESFLELLASITAKRAKTVIDHILKHGSVNTDDLQTSYGYTHGPRAARDVREQGIPLETFTVVSQLNGRKIAAYKFGDLSKIRGGRLGGRLVFSKQLKTDLVTHYGEVCNVCNGAFKERYLQIDHRVPYEVAGDEADRKLEHFQLLCASCNRAKSWSCESCENWLKIRDPSLCNRCYWGSPEHYDHIALEAIRRLDMMWNASEVEYYDTLKEIADQNGLELPTLIKNILAKHIEG